MPIVDGVRRDWGELYADEVPGALLRALPGVLIVALASYPFLGELPETVSREERTRDLRNLVIKRELGGTAAQGYRDRFVEPVALHASGSRGGRKVLRALGAVLAGSGTSLLAGQDCLGKTPYDRGVDDTQTNPTAKTLAVPPLPGSATSTLRFTIGEAGGLTPADTVTINTLGLYGCDTTGGTVIPIKQWDEQTQGADLGKPIELQ